MDFLLLLAGYLIVSKMKILPVIYFVFTRPRLEVTRGLYSLPPVPPCGGTATTRLKTMKTMRDSVEALLSNGKLTVGGVASVETLTMGPENTRLVGSSPRGR